VSPSLARTAGGLAAAAPFALVLGPTLTAGGVAVALVAGSLLLIRHFRVGRWFATAGVAGAFALNLDLLAGAPAAALAALILGMSVLAAIWLPTPPSAALVGVADSVLASRARAAAAVLLLASIAALGSGEPVPRLAGPVALSWITVAGLALAWRARSGGTARVVAALLPGAAAGAGVAMGELDVRLALFAGALLPASLLLSRHGRPQSDRLDLSGVILRDPARLLVASFFVLCSTGMLLLLLPAATTAGRSLGLADAAFTAVSAACVTGLVVVDTGTVLSGSGQAIVLLLIQFGGLGIMAFSTAAFAALGLRISLHYEGAIAELLGDRDRGRLAETMQRLILFTLAAEALGAAVLSGLFLRAGDTPGMAAWRGVFTAVSAFCNAGFALQADSLVGYAESPAVIHTVAVLVILGGLSPAGAAGLWWLGRGKRPSLQVGLVLTTSALLLALGTLAVAALEWRHSLQALGPIDRLTNAWFQSVTLRTAGFNSVAFEALSPATLALMMVWMFIGGSPGSTAGGIKTTTAAVLLLAALAAIRGREQAAAFGRRVPHSSVYRAAAIGTLGAGTVLGGVIALLLTQDIAPGAVLFEVVSATGTVGLSLGATAELDGLGKLVVMGCMFMGRVGPLTAFMLLSRRSGSESWRIPEEGVDVG
jgi:trk system potassium uptake protein TrkH